MREDLEEMLFLEEEKQKLTESFDDKCATEDSATGADDASGAMEEDATHDAAGEPLDVPTVGIKVPVNFELY